MNATMFQRFSVFSTVVLLSASTDTFSQGTVVTGSIVFGQPGAAPPGTYLMANAYPSGPNGGFFVLSLATISPGNYQLNYYGIAELYSLHAVNAGEAFTPVYVASDTPLLNNNNTPGSYQFSLGLGQSRLFGYWDDALYLNNPLPGGTGGVPDATDAYGWFRLTRQVSGLVIADSATAMGGGIFAGTYNPVPEPSVAPLLVAGAFVLGFRRKSI